MPTRPRPRYAPRLEESEGQPACRPGRKRVGGAVAARAGLVYAALTSPAPGDAAMSGRTRLLAVAILLAAVAAAPAAPPDVLELVPEDAALALAIRNLTDLKKKGDKFFADAGLKEDRALLRPSLLF